MRAQSTTDGRSVGKVRAPLACPIGRDCVVGNRAKINVSVFCISMNSVYRIDFTYPDSKLQDCKCDIPSLDRL